MRTRTHSPMNPRRRRCRHSVGAGTLLRGQPGPSQLRADWGGGTTTLGVVKIPRAKVGGVFIQNTAAAGPQTATVRGCMTPLERDAPSTRRDATRRGRKGGPAQQRTTPLSQRQTGSKAVRRVFPIGVEKTRRPVWMRTFIAPLPTCTAPNSTSYLRLPPSPPTTQPHHLPPLADSRCHCCFYHYTNLRGDSFFQKNIARQTRSDAP